MRLLPAVVMGVGIAGVAHAAEIAPGAVVSNDGRTVYLRTAAGALQARAVPGGALRWQAADLRPLAADGARLLAQRAAGEGRLDLLFLDAASGRTLEERTHALPPRVSSPFDEALGTRFDLRATASGARVLLAWRFDRRPVRGADLEEEEEGEGEEDEVVSAAGAVSVDLASARVNTATALVAALAALPPAVDARLRRGGLRERPLTVGAYFVATARSGERLSLERWTAAGEPLPPVPLPSGAVLQLGAADGRHVLVSREQPGAPLEQAHEWTVIALDTGAVAATLRTSVAAAPFEVAGGRVLLVLEAWGHRAPGGWRDEPRLLQAFDPHSAAAWTEALRDPAYHGPVAP
jgi:hypothetical protein